LYSRLAKTHAHTQEFYVAEFYLDWTAGVMRNYCNANIQPSHANCTCGHAGITASTAVLDRCKDAKPSQWKTSIFGPLYSKTP